MRMPVAAWRALDQNRDREGQQDTEFERQQGQASR